MKNTNQSLEIWKDIPFTKGFYQSNNKGSIKSLKRKKEIILKPVLNKNGYLYVNVVIDNKIRHVQVHSLLAMSFLGHIPYKKELVVDHKNNIKTDNRLENLQLITSRKNNSKNRKSKTSNYTGVRICSNKKWRASIDVMGKQIHLGVFNSEKEADVFYKKALKSLEKNTEINVKKPNYYSNFKGVSFNKKNNKWISRITKNGSRVFLGSFDTELEAYNSITLNQV